MKKLDEQSLKALTLLSVVLPVSLLISFRLTGILPEPPKPEAIMLDTVKWESERPSFYVIIDDIVESIYDSDVFINQSVFVSRYFDQFGVPYGDVDVITLVTNITATISKGFIETIHVFFAENYTLSKVNVWDPQRESAMHVLYNLAVMEWADKGSENAWKLKNNIKAFITLGALDQPTKVDYWTPTDWILRSPQNQSHQMSIVYEVSYFNGTTHKRVVQPFELKIGPDDNNSFETADGIEPGAHESYVDSRNDKTDYYASRIEKGQLVQVSLANVQYAGADLYLYDPSQTLRAQSLFSEGGEREITLTADSAGWWYIKVDAFSEHFLAYLLHVSISSQGKGQL